MNTAFTLWVNSSDVQMICIADLHDYVNVYKITDHFNQTQLTLY